MRRQYDRSQWSECWAIGLRHPLLLGRQQATSWPTPYERLLRDRVEADRGAVLMTFAAGYRPEDFALT